MQSDREAGDECVDVPAIDSVSEHAMAMRPPSEASSRRPHAGREHSDPLLRQDGHHGYYESERETKEPECIGYPSARRSGEAIQGEFRPRWDTRAVEVRDQNDKQFGGRFRRVALELL